MYSQRSNKDGMKDISTPRPVSQPTLDRCELMPIYPRCDVVLTVLGPR